LKCFKNLKTFLSARTFGNKSYFWYLSRVTASWQGPADVRPIDKEDAITKGIRRCHRLLYRRRLSFQ